MSINRRNFVITSLATAVAAGTGFIFFNSNKARILTASNCDWKKLAEAINRNVLVYDNEGAIGTITNRLHDLMTDVVSKRGYYYAEGPQKIGNNIVDILECDEEINKFYFEKEKCNIAFQTSHHPHNDVKLLIGLTDTGNYLLGSC
jgi:hypothetical protein